MPGARVHLSTEDSKELIALVQEAQTRLGTQLREFLDTLVEEVQRDRTSTLPLLSRQVAEVRFKQSSLKFLEEKLQKTYERGVRQ